MHKHEKRRKFEKKVKYLFCFDYMYVGSYLNSLHRVSHYPSFIDEETDSKEFYVNLWQSQHWKLEMLLKPEMCFLDFLNVELRLALWN